MNDTDGRSLISKFFQFDDNVDWISKGNCWGNLQATNDLYAPSEVKQLEAAKLWCSNCPVKKQCLEYGLEDSYGVWGGLTPSERKVIAKKRKANESSKRKLG